ncbi:CLUMA_CG016725, isoform A [Clunio marinus]|uniref:CLUMA_CG016725, isoform A n=1 Tax=Clunio marinus TaxID=568069 RepID=A0A1J1IWJ2_9DIPT|nr:CLUMA_CG016725, isoform A [Clunio marinus]
MKSFGETLVQHKCLKGKRHLHNEPKKLFANMERDKTNSFDRKPFHFICLDLKRNEILSLHLLRRQETP